VLQKPSAGRLDFEGVELTRLPDHKLRPLRQKLQYVGGHPARALAAHVTVRAVLQEPLDIHRLGTAAERQTRIEAALEQWRLNAWLLNRLVASLSTTLRQKLALARALIFRPRVLLADEVVDHLEPAAAVPMLEHLARLCRADAITWLWTTRDATLAARFADRVLRVEGGTLSPA
jgi:ABC-type glutathione transport system ATPase component